jgi:transcriptional regulator with XRE-family HTH domain
MTDQEIKNAFDNLLLPKTEKETYQLKGQVLAMKFLGEIDEEMARQKMKKKELASQIGTSASYITQLFRGDKKPTWEILARMAEVLNMDFYVTTKEKHVRSHFARTLEMNGEWFFLHYDSAPKASYNVEIAKDQFALAV